MVQFPLRWPGDGSISSAVHPLGMRAEGVQLFCSTSAEVVQWNLCHEQAIAMEIAP